MLTQKKVLGLKKGLILCVAVVTPFLCFGYQWQVQVLDWDTTYLGHPSLALDSQSKPHLCWIFWSYSGRTMVKHEYWNGLNWICDILPIVTGGSIREGLCLNLDSSDRPHLAAGDHTVLYYFHKSNSTWITKIVDSLWLPATYFGYPSLRLDTQEQPHIAYFLKSAGRTWLKYARYDGFSWHNEVVDSMPYSTSDHATDRYLALDSAGHPHICYPKFVNSSGKLMYAHHNGISWDIMTLDSSLEISDPSLQLDQNGYPHVTYTEKYYTGEMRKRAKYVFKDSIGWHIEVVQDGDCGYDSSLELDTLDQPHVAYYWHAVNYAWKDSMGWHIETADPGAGSQNSLRLDYYGLPHIASRRKTALPFSIYEIHYINAIPQAIKEKSEKQKLAIRLKAIPNPFVSFTTIPGCENEDFVLYNIVGMKVGIYQGDQMGEGLPAGVYFLMPESNEFRPVRVVKLR